MNETIDVLAMASHKQTVALLKRLGGGTVGVNYAKFSLDELKAWGRERYGAMTIFRAWEEEATSPAEARPVEPAPVEASPAPTPRPVAPDAGATVATAVAGAVAAALGSIRLGVDEEAVRAIVDERLSLVQPARIIVDGPTEVRIEERTHPAFEKTLRACRAGLNVLLVGPAGCGKTTLAHHVAKGLGRDKFAAVSCSAGMSESHLSGWLLPVGEGGRFAFVSSAFLDAYATGGVCLIDEIDASDPNVLVFANSMLANGGVFIPQRMEGQYVKRHPDTVVVAAANTYGTGPDAVYVGRNQLDAATLDRFYVVAMDYDPALERAICGLPYVPGEAWTAGEAATPQELAGLGQWVLDLRQKAVAAKLRRVISTRAVQKAVAARSAGIPTDEVKRDLLAGWTRDELAKVGI